MPWEVHSGLSGQGFAPLTSVTSPLFERTFVTSLGAAEALDPAAPSRYLHLGFWAFYEDLVDFGDGFPDGKYISQYHWLNYVLESWNDRTSVDAQGYSGIYWRLYPGVVISLGVFAP